MITIDAFSHSWKSMFAQMAKYITSSVHHAFVCSPHVQSQVERLLGLALRTQVVGRFRPRQTEHKTDSSHTCSETLPETSVFTTLRVPKTQRRCRVEHFPPCVLSVKVPRENSKEDLKWDSMWGTTSGLIMSGAAMMHKDISSVTCNQAFYV